MNAPAVFPYVQMIPTLGPVGLMPMLPVTLTLNGTRQTSLALVDSRSTLNVIPFQLGLQLGGDWNQFRGSLPIGGPLAGYPAKPLFADVAVARFPPVRLSFAWTQAPNARLILGQMNFFAEFDVLFYRHRGEFHIQPATP